MMIKRTIALLGVLAAFTPLAAQTNSEGVFLGTPAALLVDAGTHQGGAPLADNLLYRRTAGFAALGPEVSPGVGVEPVFTTTALFGDGLAPPNFRINAISLGLDVVLSDPPVAGKAFVNVPPQAWGALLFSVTRTSKGAPGSVIESEFLSPGGAGADLFSLMLPGSFLHPSVQPCYPADRPQRAMDALELGIDAFPPGDFTAGDFFIPLYEAGTPIRASLPNAPTLFFSIHKDDVFPPTGPSLVPPGWFGVSLPSSATILVTQWIPSNSSWTTPKVHISYTNLGLSLTDDVDALAVDRDDEILLFSIARTATSTLEEQLQIAYWGSHDSFSGGGTTASTGRYYHHDSSGGSESVAATAGVGETDDVDLSCTIDPGEQGNALSMSIGTPAGKITPFKLIPGSLFRDEDSAGPTITITGSNIPVGPTTPLQTLDVWLGAPLGGGSYFLFPFPLYSEALTGVNPLSTRSVSFSDPSLAVILGLQIDLFWIIRGSGIRLSSALLRIDV